jgi:hypothetical protein
MKKQTIVFDLETMNAIAGMEQKWQMEILKNLSGGIAAGTMNVFSAGRQTGKSSMTLKVFKDRYYDTNLCKEIMFSVPAASKYKFSRAKWHTVDIGMGSWRLGREYNDIITWCNETFGAHPKKPDAWSRWWVGIGQIYFRDQQDLVLYKLKWS